MRKLMLFMAFAIVSACTSPSAPAHPWAGRYALVSVNDTTPAPSVRGHIELASDGTFVDVLTAPHLGWFAPDTMRGTWQVAPQNFLTLIYKVTNSGFEVKWQNAAFTLPLYGERWKYAR